MRVFRADNGVALDVNASPETIVNQLKDSLSRICSIPVPDQILLCEGVKMESTSTLKAYGLPLAEKRVFLYDRRTLQSELPPPDALLPNFDYKVPAPVPLPFEQKQYINSVVWQLMEHESEFLERYNNSELIRKAAEARLEFIKNLVFEQDIMIAALQSSFGPLSEHINQVSQAYDAFLQKYKPEAEQHEMLLSTFEENMKKLKEIRLHHTLVTSSGVQTLMDVVPEVRLRRWAEECANDHTQLQARVGELSRQFISLKESIETEKKKSPEPDYLDRKSLQLQLKKAEDIKTEVQYLSQIFLSDYNVVKDRLSISRRTPSNDLLDGLADIRNKDINYLAKMKEREQSLKAITQLVALSKNKLSKYIVERLRVVAGLGTKCRDVANKVVAYHEASQKQKQSFFQLIYVQRMPKAYQASLEEVLRRRTYAKKVNFLIQKITEILAKVREEENAKRKSYLENHGRFIPKDLILGLTEFVPAFDISFSNFDTSLPQIDNGSSTTNVEEFGLLLTGFGDDQSSKVAELEKENERLQAELRAARGSQSHEKDKQIIELQSSVIEKEELSKDYKQRVELLEAQLSASYARVQRAEFMVQHLNDKLEDMEKQKKGESEELQEARKKLEEAQQIVNQLDSTKDTMSELRAMVASQSSRIEALLREIDQTKDQIKVETSRAEQLIEKKAEADQKISLLQKELEAKTAEIDQLSHSIDYHKAEMGELNDKISQMSTEQQSLQSEIQDLKNNIAKLREQENKLKASLDEKSRTILQQEEKINHIQNASQQKNTNAEEVSKSLMNEIERLQSKIRELEEKSQHDELKIKDHQSSAATYRQRANKIEEEKRLLNEQLLEANQKSSKALEEKNWIIRQLNEKLGKLNEGNTRLEEEKKKLQLLAAQATDRADRAEKAAKPMTGSTLDDRKYIEAVNALDAKNRQNIELGRTIQMLEKKIASTENDLSNLRSAVRKVQELTVEARQSVGDDDDLSILRLKISSLIEDRERLIKEADTQKAIMIEYNMKLEESDKKQQELLSRITAFEYELGNRRLTEAHSPKISVANFQYGDYVLFVPNKNSFYEAYPHGSNYFLSPEALKYYDDEKKEQKPILGSVIEVVTSKAAPSFNPFKLPMGASFHELVISKE